MWDAFCTIHWFITGDRIISTSEHPYSTALYYWFLGVEDKGLTPGVLDDAFKATKEIEQGLTEPYYRRNKGK